MTLRRATAGTAVLVVAFVLVLRDTAPTFVYDAAQYWRGNELVQTGRDPSLQGGLHARGVLTSFAYLPAAAGAAWLVSHRRRRSSS